jgi:hypothetical protein
LASGSALAIERTQAVRRCECGQYPDVCARYGHHDEPATMTTFAEWWDKTVIAFDSRLCAIGRERDLAKRLRDVAEQTSKWGSPPFDETPPVADWSSFMEAAANTIDALLDDAPREGS